MRFLLFLSLFMGIVTCLLGDEYIIDIEVPNYENSTESSALNDLEEAIDLGSSWSSGSYLNLFTSSPMKIGILNSTFKDLSSEQLENFLNKYWLETTGYNCYNGPFYLRFAYLLSQCEEKDKFLNDPKVKLWNDGLNEIYALADKYEKLGRKKNKVEYLKRAYYLYLVTYSHNDSKDKSSALKKFTTDLIDQNKVGKINLASEAKVAEAKKSEQIANEALSNAEKAILEKDYATAIVHLEKVVSDKTSSVFEQASKMLSDAKLSHEKQTQEREMLARKEINDKWSGKGRLSKSEWKEKIAAFYPNSGIEHGVGVLGDPTVFIENMGKPDNITTVGEKGYYHYFCTDGKIQLVFSKTNFDHAKILLVSAVNEY